METRTASTHEEGFLSRMALNDNKAGMEGLDRDKINKIIIESSKGSRFYENELKKEQQVNQRIEKLMLQKSQITEQQFKKAQSQVEKLASELERHRDLSRVIVHVDMDAFYAAVEIRDCPDLKDNPMAVGSTSMLSTSNYLARKFGVRAGMPGFIAKKLCPSLIIVPTNFDKYRAVSNEVKLTQITSPLWKIEGAKPNSTAYTHIYDVHCWHNKIRDIFADYDPHFQPLSLDEAYLDFTDHLEQRKSWPETLRTHRLRPSTIGTVEAHNGLPQETVAEVEGLSPVLFDDSLSTSPSLPGGRGADDAGGGVEVFGTSAEEAVREMRFRIEQKTMLTASAGIAPNMMLAKVCSDKNKPNGQYRLPSNREAVMDFIQNLPVRKVFGIGKVSEKMLGALGISSCSHLTQQMALLSLLFSETSWHHFMQISLGLGSTHIERDGERKSMSTERTFREMSAPEEQLCLCRELCEDLAKDLKKEGLKGKTVTLKLKNVHFEVKTRAWTLPCAVATTEEIFAVAKDLLKTEVENVSPQPLRLRLMGVRVSTFISSDDKKPLQKSIVGFLQQGRADCVGPSQREQLSDGSVQSRPAAHQQHSQKGHESIPWLAGQRVSEGNGDVEQQQQQQESFFQRAQAQRLRLQAERSEEEPKNDSTVLPPATYLVQESGRATTQAHPGSESIISASDSTSAADVRAFPMEAHASTSGVGATHPESLTCPVCFRQVESTDLGAFNRHIDRCLSGVSSGANHNTHCDSDGGREKGYKGWEVKDSDAEMFEGREMAEDNVKQSKDIAVFMTSKTGVNMSNQEVLEANGKDHHSQNNVDMTSHLRASVVHNGSPGKTSSQQTESQHKGLSLTCPVCQVAQDTDDLIAFNHHVDLCLNEEVLHELGGHTTTINRHSVPVINSKVRDKPLPSHACKGKSKRRGSPPSPPSKKTKSLGPQSTIDQFFR